MPTTIKDVLLLSHLDTKHFKADNNAKKISIKTDSVAKDLLSTDPDNLLTVDSSGKLYYGVEAPANIAVLYIDAVAGVDRNPDEHPNAGRRSNPLKTIQYALSLGTQGTNRVLCLKESQEHLIHKTIKVRSPKVLSQPYGEKIDQLTAESGASNIFSALTYLFSNTSNANFASYMAALPRVTFGEVTEYTSGGKKNLSMAQFRGEIPTTLTFLGVCIRTKTIPAGKFVGIQELNSDRMSLFVEAKVILTRGKIEVEPQEYPEGVPVSNRYVVAGWSAAFTQYGNGGVLPLDTYVAIGTKPPTFHIVSNNVEKVAIPVQEVANYKPVAKEWFVYCKRTIDGEMVNLFPNPFPNKWYV